LGYATLGVRSASGARLFERAPWRGTRSSEYPGSSDTHARRTHTANPRGRGPPYDSRVSSIRQFALGVPPSRGSRSMNSFRSTAQIRNSKRPGTSGITEGVGHLAASPVIATPVGTMNSLDASVGACCEAGNCSTVACWPSRKACTRAIRPSANSKAS